MPAVNARPLLIDTDMGVDDALALVLAARSPELRIEAVTTVAGNVRVDLCTRNVRHMFELLGTERLPAVVQGAAKPLRRPLFTAPEVHGADGLGNTIGRVRHLPRSTPRAAHEILSQCRLHGNALTIVAVGPLTNIARALQRDARTLKRAGRIISMGGAFRVPGNTGPVAEFNYYVDPDAADIVLNAGLPVTVVPLDVTEQCVVLAQEFRRAVRGHPTRVGKALVRITRDYMKYHAVTEGFDGGYLHDPLAIAAAADPTLLTTLPMHVRVETQSPLTRGMTVAEVRYGKHSRRPTVEVAVAVDRTRFLRIFFDRVVG